MREILPKVEACSHLRKAGYGPGALYGVKSNKSPGSLTQLPMLKPKNTPSKNGHCSFCLSPLIRFKWNSVCVILTCDNWNCLCFRRPAGVINMVPSLEENQTHPRRLPVEDICLNCLEKECIYKIKESHHPKKCRKATNEDIREVRRLYDSGIAPYRINSSGVFPQLKRATIERICTQNGAYSKEWEGNHGHPVR